MGAGDEEDFVYRSRRPQAPMDAAVRRMVLAAGGVSVLVIVVALLWSGVRATGFGPPPLIMPQAGPLRVAPVDPGGLEVPQADEPIMSGAQSAAPPRLAPAPAAPAISQLDAQAGMGVPAAPVVAPLSPAPPVVHTKSEPPAAGGKTVGVQLAATSDEAGAEAMWSHLQARLPDLFAGRTPDILPAVVNGSSVWRLRLGGFASVADAQDFCARVQAQKAACTVAAF
ncbi:MAG: SPOR domain-containing protein [Acidocella sp.]|nr:SPOR domain-containing protein [Acidocella sp.]